MKNKFNLRRILPFIPIIGMFLTAYYHSKYGDTGIENNYINIISAIIQALCLFFLTHLIVF